MFDYFVRLWLPRGGGGSIVLSIIRDPSPERANFFRLEEYKRVEISRVEVKERVRNFCKVFQR